MEFLFLIAGLVIGFLWGSIIHIIKGPHINCESKEYQNDAE